MMLEDRSQSNLREKLEQLWAQLPSHKYNKRLERALQVLIRLAEEDVDSLEWKILSAALEDMEKGFTTFAPYRHTRKITIFGSARISPDSQEYFLAREFARKITKLGFMVLTGAGGGIMAAGNEGAGRENSFGLNVKLPFEQNANAFICGDFKLINFKYFFTRKLFFLKESDAIALFPGGFGTQDEAFETLALCQTGKQSPIPLVLIDEPHRNYWQSWHDYLCKSLLKKGLIGPADLNLYTITDSIEVACDTIQKFYRVYHSSRYVGDLFVIRLNYELSDAQVEQLNREYQELLLKGKIEKIKALPAELGDETANLPRIAFYFDPKKYGDLYQMIETINSFTTSTFPQHQPQQR